MSDLERIIGVQWTAALEGEAGPCETVIRAVRAQAEIRGVDTGDS